MNLETTIPNCIFTEHEKMLAVRVHAKHRTKQQLSMHSATSSSYLCLGLPGQTWLLGFMEDVVWWLFFSFFLFLCQLSSFTSWKDFLP